MVYTADGDRLIRDDGDTVTAYLPNAEVTWDRDTDEVEGTRYFTHAGQVVAVCTGLDVADWVYLGVDHHGTTTTHAVNALYGNFGCGVHNRSTHNPDRCYGGRYGSGCARRRDRWRL